MNANVRYFDRMHDAWVSSHLSVQGNLFSSKLYGCQWNGSAHCFFRGTSLIIIVLIHKFIPFYYGTWHIEVQDHRIMYTW